MSIVAPKGRKHLCGDSLFRLLRENFATLADDRVDEVEIPLNDALISPFAPSGANYLNCKLPIDSNLQSQPL